MENRRKACIKKYWATVEEYKEARTARKKWWDDFDECFELGILNAYLLNIDEIVNRWQELGNKKESAFNDWVVVGPHLLLR